MSSTASNLIYVINVIRSTVFKYPRIGPLLGIIFITMFFSNYYELKISDSITKQMAPSFDSRDSSLFSNGLFYYLVYSVSHYVLGAAYMSIYHFFAPSIEEFITKQFHRSYLECGFAEFNSLGSGRINAQIMKQTDSIMLFLEDVVIKLGYDLVFYVVMLMSLVRKSKNGVITSFLLFVISMLMFFAFETVVFSTKLRSKQLKDLSRRMNKQHDIIRNYSIIKAYNNEDLEITKLESESKSYTWSSRGFNLSGRVSDFIFRAFVLLSATIIYYGTFHGIFFNKLSREDLESVGSILTLIKVRTTKLKENIFRISECYADLLSYRLPNPEDQGKTSIMKCQDGIEFKNVSISKGDVPLFFNFNALFRSGDKIAITGKNGCGKSSVLETLMKFNSYKGSIEIDGHQISNSNGKSLRDIISYIPQEFMLMTGTVYDNLTYARPGMSIEDVHKVCKYFGCHDFFQNLKKGYLTNVGEQGRFLSGGQCQMINFMRGVIKDAPIFFLDEPTSNLDVEHSVQLMDMVFTLLVGKTVFMTTHDPEHLKRFDVILNIRDKEVFVYKNYEQFARSVDPRDLI